jgi:hypothetical protein
MRPGQRAEPIDVARLMRQRSCGGSLSYATSTVLAMSLTSLLADPKSPLSRFLATELPDGKGFSAAFRAIRPPDADAVRPLVPEGTRVPWGTLGAAIDHRIRYALSDRGLPTGAVALGMDEAPGHAATTSARTAIVLAADELRDELTRLVGEERTAERSQPILLSATAEDRLCRVCYAMTWFEEVFRTGRLWPGTPLGDADGGLTLEHLLAAVPEYAVADLVAQVKLAEYPLAALRASVPPAAVHIGPTFEGSRDVGGADADAIVGTTLLEIKSTLTPSKHLARKDFCQLIGYALLDYQNRYSIERIALYLARFGKLYTWTVAEYLGLFGSQNSMETLRAGCQGLLTARPVAS